MRCVRTVVIIVGVKRMKIRTYTELIKLESFIDRYNYLRLGGVVGSTTFGFDRYLNQLLYTSKRWRATRDRIIIRDNSCDLGLEDYELHSGVIIHHMNPITIEDVENDSDLIYDPEFLICTSSNTHNAIHYSDATLLPRLPITRRPGDTIPWR